MKKKLSFIKISATGNDFILIDNRDAGLNRLQDAALFSRLCQVHRAIGADGVILLEKSDRADFRYVHINANGSNAEMCGNGSRAISWFARELGIVTSRACFEINHHIYHSVIDGSRVTTEFISPGRFDPTITIVEEPDFECGGFIDTGVPHLVLYVDQVARTDVAVWGHKYRHHPFFPAGTNVDFVQVQDLQTLAVRTFERGVEAETLACGTGAVASALVSQVKKGILSPCQIHFPGGSVQVAFSEDWQKIHLTGLVTPVYRGVVEESFYA